MDLRIFTKAKPENRLRNLRDLALKMARLCQVHVKSRERDGENW